MKKAGPCVLAGYFGFGNAGDEMIMRQVLGGVPGVPWVVLTSAPSLLPPGVAAHGRWNFLHLAGLFRRSRALVLGGGELFQTRTSRLSFFYYALLVAWARLWGLEVWAFGTGVDPQLPLWARFLLRQLLGKALRVWARDEATMCFFQKIPSGPPAALSPDPVWAWPAPPPAARPDGTLWILRGEGLDARSWADALNAISRESSEEQGFLALHPALDMVFLAALRRRLCFFHRLETWRDLQEVPAICGRYSRVVSMRYHGLVAAGLAGRPAVALTSHGKVAALAGALGWPTLAPADLSPRSLSEALARATAPDVSHLRRGAAQALDELKDALTSPRDGNF